MSYSELLLPRFGRLMCVIAGLVCSVSGALLSQPTTGAVLNASLEGVVIDASTGLAIGGAVVTITGEVDKRVEKQEVGSDGAFRFRLSSQQAYQLVTQANGYAPAQERLAFTSQYTNRLYGKRIRLTQTTAEREVRPSTIQFEKRSTELLPPARAALGQLWQYMKSNPTATVELAGHTDNQGDAELNRLLAQDRVETVKAFLVANGIAPRRITTQNYGGTRPTTQGTNRRVDVIYR